jgi:hypothetical protein
MVLAVAALLFQIQPIPQSAFAFSHAAFNPPAAAVEATAAPDTKTTKKDADPILVHLDLDSVNTDKNSSADQNAPKEPKLSAVNDVTFTDTQKQSFSTIRIPDAESPKPIPFSSVEPLPSRKTWLALSMVQSGAATFDAYSTRQAIGHGAVEDDPTMRPFAHSPGLYAAIQVGPVLLDYLARRMQRSEHNVFRRTWWMPQSISTAGFIISGVHNIGVSDRSERR